MALKQSAKKEALKVLLLCKQYVFNLKNGSDTSEAENMYHVTEYFVTCPFLRKCTSKNPIT